MIPKPWTFWNYIGPGDGRGEVHLVVFSRPNEIITVGDNRSWLGDKATFFQHFKAEVNK